VLRSQRRVPFDMSTPAQNPEKPRILFVDGIRCLAILPVVLYHYYSRWTPPSHEVNLYPYGGRFSQFFSSGYYGVHLFFIVSGFVITLTLHKCDSIREFAVRRLARLWPTMALCSTLTYLALTILPNRLFNSSPAYFVPSLTFTDPDLLNGVFGTRSLDWIDGAYWSLFVEVRFYILAAAIYFVQKNQFARNMLWLGSTISLGYALVVSRGLPGVFQLELFCVAKYLPWFLVGISFYYIHSGLEEKRRKRMMALAIIALLLQPLAHGYRPNKFHMAIPILLPLLFYVASRWTPLNRLLSSRVMVAIGASSYSLYLLHQNAGVSLIDYIASTLRLHGSPSAVIPLLVAIAFGLLALMIHRLWESPLNALIVKRLNRSKARAMGASVAPAAKP